MFGEKKIAYLRENNSTFRHIVLSINLGFSTSIGWVKKKITFFLDIW